MKVDIDLEGVLRSAQEMPNEISHMEDVHPDLQAFYRQDGDRLRLDTSHRDEFIAHLSSRLESYNLQQENAKLKDEGNRRQVVEMVRGQLSRFVKPELMSAAMALFISQHKFGLKDGKVTVVGKRGREEAEMAAINWIMDDGEPFSSRGAHDSISGGFSAEVSRLKNMH